MYIDKHCCLTFREDQDWGVLTAGVSNEFATPRHLSLLQSDFVCSSCASSQLNMAFTKYDSFDVYGVLLGRCSYPVYPETCPNHCFCCRVVLHSPWAWMRL